MSDSVFIPDYSHAILGIPNSILQYYGVRPDYPTLTALNPFLTKKPKNIVIWILDGMGSDLIGHILSPHAFLRRHIVDHISSVFPPTTAAATTTYYSALPPMSHGWAGWSPYFAEAGKYIELFTGKDTITKEPTALNPAEILAYKHIFTRIHENDKTVTCSKIFPKKITPDGATTFEEQANRIVAQSRQPGPQLIMAYWPDPDHTCHYTGTYSPDVREVLRSMNRTIRRMSQRLRDTLLIISADHGHIPTESFVFLNDYPDILDCLAIPINLDDRVSSVFLKPGQESAFKTAFQRHLSDDFLLIKSADAIRQNLFGPGKAHPRLAGFLGDYLIIAIGGRVLRQHIENGESGPIFKSCHAGLTKREMVVPLIVVDKI